MIVRVLLIALAAVAAFAALQTWRLHAAQMELKEQEVQTLAAVAAAAEQARFEEQRRVLAAQEIANEARKREEQARADADAAAAAGSRLRQALAAARRAACSDPAPAGSSQAADATEGMLADVQRRLDEATDRIGRFADQAYSAGLACQQAYDSLSR